MLMERKCLTLQLIAGILGTTVGLFGIGVFNQYILMRLPLAARMVSMIVTYWSIALVPLLIMLLAKEHPSQYGFSSGKIGIQLLIGAAIGIGMSLLLTLLPMLTGMGEWVNNGKSYQYGWQFFYEFFYCIFAVGLAEEYVFRGFLFTKIKAIVNSTPAAIIGSSLLFGLFHILNGNALQIIMTALLGVFWCVCREKIKYCSLLSLIAAHGIYDALITVWTSVFP